MDFITFFLANLPEGLTAGGIFDTIIVVILGALAGLARELYDKYQNNLPSGFFEGISRMIIGVVGGLAGAEMSYILFQGGEYTWLAALAVGWSGGDLLNKITLIFAEKLDAEHEHVEKEPTFQQTAITPAEFNGDTQNI